MILFFKPEYLFTLILIRFTEINSADKVEFRSVRNHFFGDVYSQVLILF